MTHGNRKDYRAILWEHFQSRRDKNPGYSMRAYARDLNTSNQKLSQVLNGRTGLSLTSAREISQRLDLSTKENEIFIVSVEAFCGRNKTLRLAAKKKWSALVEEHGFRDVTSHLRDGLKWYHFPVFMLAGMFPEKLSADMLVTKLGLKREEALSALDDLVRAGVLEKNGRYFRQTHILFSVHSEKSTNSMTELYRVMLKKAIDALAAVGVDERDHSVGYVTCAKADIEYAKSKIAEFRRNLVKDLCERSENPDRLYSINIQLIPLDLGKGSSS